MSSDGMPTLQANLVMQDYYFRHSLRLNKNLHVTSMNELT